MKEKDTAQLVEILKSGAPPSLMKQIISGNISHPELRANASLRKDEWIEIDKTVQQVSMQRLVVVRDLINANLFLNIPNGLGKLVLETENISDLSDAKMSMDGIVDGEDDAVEYDLVGTPLPITMKGFTISARKLAASRNGGTPLDTTQATACARKVAELIENTTINGGGTFKSGGYNLYGLVNHPSTQSVTLAAHWDSTSTMGTNIVDDVLEMRQASLDAKRFGPWMLYVPTAYERALDENFTTSYDLTTRERIKKIGGIQDVKVADKLPADHVLLVEMQPDTARIIIGMQPATVEWSTKGNMLLHYMVMAIMVPQVRADQDGNCGVILLHG